MIFIVLLCFTIALLFHCFSKVYSPLRLELVVTDGQLVELLSAMEITSQLYQNACTENGPTNQIFACLLELSR